MNCQVKQSLQERVGITVGEVVAREIAATALFFEPGFAGASTGEDTITAVSVAGGNTLLAIIVSGENAFIVVQIADEEIPDRVVNVCVSTTYEKESNE